MALGVIKEFRCLDHGEFEASHAICPALGCDSRMVVREFRTAPKVGTQFVKRFDAGIKHSADMYRISDFRSAREGEAAYGGNVKDVNGNGVLWGDQCRKVLGRSFSELSQIAQKPLVVERRDGSGAVTLTRNNALADAAESAGLTGRRLAKPGELSVAHEDKASAGIAKAITT